MRAFGLGNRIAEEGDDVGDRSFGRPQLEVGALRGQARQPGCVHAPCAQLAEQLVRRAVLDAGVDLGDPDRLDGEGPRASESKALAGDQASNAMVANTATSTPRMTRPMPLCGASGGSKIRIALSSFGPAEKARTKRSIESGGEGDSKRAGRNGVPFRRGVKAP